MRIAFLCLDFLTWKAGLTIPFSLPVTQPHEMKGVRGWPWASPKAWQRSVQPDSSPSGPLTSLSGRPALRNLLCTPFHSWGTGESSRKGLRRSSQPGDQSPWVCLCPLASDNPDVWYHLHRESTVLPLLSLVEAGQAGVGGEMDTQKPWPLAPAHAQAVGVVSRERLPHLARDGFTTTLPLTRLLGRCLRLRGLVRTWNSF